MRVGRKKQSRKVYKMCSLTKKGIMLKAVDKESMTGKEIRATRKKSTRMIGKVP